ncbi:hypothetical protein EBU71_12680, partial [bacterium]|nr:hypothetical protein [Candidatus Elulimicrobium humile]
VDEDLQNYIELYTWIRELGFPNDFSEYKSIASKPVYTGLGVVSDISLIILSSSRNPTHEVIFKDAFPISISSLIFDSTNTDVQFLEASATFKYRSYSIQNI